MDQVAASVIASSCHDNQGAADCHDKSQEESQPDYQVLVRPDMRYNSEFAKDRVECRQ